MKKKKRSGNNHWSTAEIKLIKKYIVLTEKIKKIRQKLLKKRELTSIHKEVSLRRHKIK